MILNLLLVFSFLLLVAYVYLLIYILNHWQKTTRTSSLKKINKGLFLSVIIIARNEEKQIASCINSILQNSYDKKLYEIIVIDDHSTDSTPLIVSNINDVSLYSLSDYLKGKQVNAYKKEAIRFALTKSKSNHIVHIDADCIAPKNWLHSIGQTFAERQSLFIAGPVLFINQNTILSRFESLDLIGMMGVTAAGISSQNWHMANGANMAYDKKAAMASSPYKHNLASGDDVYLIQAIAKSAVDKIEFLNSTENLVFTTGNSNFKEFVAQRLRWATKNKHSKAWKYLIVMLIPFLLCLSILSNVILIQLDPSKVCSILFFQLSLKVGIDYYYLNKLSKYYKQEDLMKGFLISNFLHIFYLAAIGVLSLFISKYKWKGRLTH